MADLDWHDECLSTNLMHFEIMDTVFYLSLWESNDPFSVLKYGEHYIPVDAKYTGCKKLFKKKNPTFSLGDLPTDNVTNTTVQRTTKSISYKIL